MIRTDRRWRLCICLLCLNLAFIWGNSLLPAENSKAFSDFVAKILNKAISGSHGAGEGSGRLRKIAHFTEFCSLGIWLGWLYGMRKQHMYKPFLLGVCAACADEALQILIPGRGPGIRDVCIDSAGVAAGILFLLLGHSVCKRRLQNHSGGNET